MATGLMGRSAGGMGMTRATAGMILRRGSYDLRHNGFFLYAQQKTGNP